MLVLLHCRYFLHHCFIFVLSLLSHCWQEIILRTVGEMSIPNILCMGMLGYQTVQMFHCKSNKFQRHIIKIVSERKNSIESHIPKLPCKMLMSCLYFTTRVELNIYDKMTAVQHGDHFCSLEQLHFK